MNTLFESSVQGSVSPEDTSLLIAGDWAPIRAFAPLIEADPERLYGDLLPEIRNADISIVNLEAPLSDVGDPVTKSGAVFKGNACHVKGLSCVPFTGVTLANNHMFDFGVDAFKETVSVLDKENIHYTGAGMNLDEAQKPLIFERKGFSIAIVNFSEGEDMTAAGEGPGVVGWDIGQVCARIKALKAQGHIVIAIAHCGLEYIPFAPPYVMEAYKAAAKAGAHAVIGHHPHVPQGITWVDQTPVCCSLGNFVFYQPTSFYWRKLGYMVKLGLNPDGVTGLELIPYQIHDHGISSLNPDQKAKFLARMKEISTPLDSTQGIQDAWNGFLAYYGKAGLKNEVNMILDKMETEEGKGAAMFRNRLNCPQHFHHWTDILTRLVNGTLDHGQQWAKDLAQEWLTRQLNTGETEKGEK